MPSQLADSNVNVIVKHTFIEVQGEEEKAPEAPPRRKSDIGPIRRSQVFDCIGQGNNTPSTCPSDDDSRDEHEFCDEEDNNFSSERRVSFADSIDSDDAFGEQENRSSSPRKVSTSSISRQVSRVSFAASLEDDDDDCPVSITRKSSRVSLVSFAASIDDDDIIGAPMVVTVSTPWQAPKVFELPATPKRVDTEDTEFRGAPGLSLDSLESHDLSPASRKDTWQSTLQVLSTPSPTQGLPISASEELNSVTPELAEDNDRTTVMVRNLANDLTQTDFVKDLIARGYRGFFDFVYMPMNFRSNGNFGYAFVNFTSAGVAVQFMKHLQLFEHDEQEWRSVWSTCQGVDANVERYRNSPLMHSLVPAECKPALYDRQGFQVKFPAPTKNIPKPRIHYTKNKVADMELDSQDTSPKSAAASYGSKTDAKGQCRPGRSKRINHSLSSRSYATNTTIDHTMTYGSKGAAPTPR
jgi:hypothetical protein